MIPTPWVYRTRYVMDDPTAGTEKLVYEVREGARYVATVPLLQDADRITRAISREKDVQDTLDRLAGCLSFRRGIYGASRASVPERVAMWRRLRAAGVPIVSTWIDEADPGQSPDRGSLLERCFQEVLSCERLVLYCAREDLPLKIALAETCLALASGIPVYVVAPGVLDADLGYVTKHRLARRVDTIQQAVTGAPS